MALPERSEVGVLVVDDQAPFRQAALDVIAATSGFEPLGEAASGEEALRKACELEPELVLLDVRMPVMDGVEVARRLRAERPDVVVVLISTDDPAELPAGAGSCGAALERKQDFGPRALRRLWAAHGRRGARTALTPR